MGSDRSIFLFLTIIYLTIHRPTLILATSKILPITEEDYGSDAGAVKVYIVHAQKPTGTKFLNFRDRCNWYMSFLPNSTLDSGERRMIYMYHDVISGFAARLAASEVKTMEKMEGFILAHREGELKPLTTHTPEMLGLSTWDGLWPDSAMGSGQIIGMLDSGIKSTHLSFKDRGMPPPPLKWKGRCYWGKPICNNKLIGAASFKHGVPDSPEDKLGHGTHTAGIAAGNFVEDAELLGNGLGTASGIAPKAHLAIYKVVHQTRLRKLTASSSNALKAIDEAIRDHVDILSMSIGADKLEKLFESSIDVGSFAAVTKGIVPVAAAGNFGPSKSIIQNDSPWVLSVGASTIDRRIAVVVKLGNGKEYHGQTAYQPEPYDSPQLPLIFPGALGNVEALKCTNGSLDTFDVNGKIVICEYGGIIKNVDKSKVVMAAGGAGMILINNQYGSNTTDAEPYFIPAAHLSYAYAFDLLKNYYEVVQDPTAAFIFKGTQYGARPSPTLASWSSRGPSLANRNIIKPDVVAPGVNILSAWPFAEGPDATKPTIKTFHFQSGTSMATPHVSGIVALLRNNHPSWSPAAIKSAIMTTASVTDFSGNRIRDDYDGSAAEAYGIGAGFINPVAANDPGLIYDIDPHDYIAYLCGSGFSDSEVSAIVRGTIQCSHIHSFPADQLNYPSIALYLRPGSSRTIRRTVTNVGDPVSTYTVQFDEPKGVEMDINPPTLKFSQLDEKQNYEVTFSVKSGFSPVTDQYSDGQIAWSSGKYHVRSPIAVTFQ